MSEEWKAAQRREFSVSKILDLGQHRRQDEARRLRDLLARFIVPSLGPSRRIPSEEEIARQFHCSRNTARTALRMLAQEHMIERVVGVGTHGLKDPSIWRSDRMVDTFVVHQGVTRSIRVIGWRIGTDIPRPMLEQSPAGTERLAIFEKVLIYGTSPGSLRTYYVPLRPQDEFGVEDTAQDMYEVVEMRFGHSPISATRKIAAIAADQSAAELLEVSVGAPLLLIETVVRNSSGEVVLSYDGRQRTDLVQLSIEPERLVDE